MSAQIVEANGKPAFVLVPYDEYVLLRDLAEDAEDSAALIEFAERYASGEAETVPSAVVDRLLAGELPLRVWREHRGLTASAVAAAVGVTAAHISKLETGRGSPSVSLLARLAKVLRVRIDELICFR